MHGLSLDKCTLVSVFVESVLWGIFLASCLITLYFLFEKRPSIGKNVPYILFVTVMLVLCTMHVGLSIHQALDAFTRAPSPLVYLEETKASSARFKRSVQVVQIVLSDLLIVSRTFYLWNKNYTIVIFPFILVVGILATGIRSLLVDSYSHLVDLLDAQSQPWMIAMLVLTLATKMVCLFLVAYRVRQIHASITSHVDRHVSLYTLTLVTVESGAIALLACIVLLPIFIANRNEHYIVFDALSPIVGITSTSIIVCMTVNLTKPNTGPWTHRQAWNASNRYSVPPLARPPAPAPAPTPWDSMPDGIKVPPTAQGSVDSCSSSVRSLSKGTGTLNMAIVL